MPAHMRSLMHIRCGEASRRLSILAFGRGVDGKEFAYLTVAPDLGTAASVSCDHKTVHWSHPARSSPNSRRPACTGVVQICHYSTLLVWLQIPWPLTLSIDTSVLAVATMTAPTICWSGVVNLVWWLPFPTILARFTDSFGRLVELKASSVTLLSTLMLVITPDRSRRILRPVTRPSQIVEVHISLHDQTVTVLSHACSGQHSLHHAVGEKHLET